MADVAAALSSIQNVQSALAILNVMNLTAWRYPPICTITNGSTYDFIVVGSGSAGSVVGSRLSANSSFSVLLIEAGGYSPVESDDLPGMFPVNPRSGYDYNYPAQNDNYSAQNLEGKSFRLTAGKMLGGSGSLQHSLYVRGYPHDFDELAKLLNDSSWNYENSLKYFKKMERLTNEDLLASPYHTEYFGTDGVLALTRESNAINTDFFKAFKELGHNIENVTTKLGFAETLFNIGDGIRHSPSLGYLQLAKSRSNLCLSLFTTVTKVLIENGVAIGVQVTIANGDTYVLYAKKEVVMCAGAVNSPKLLMLSGVGPRSHLESKGIEVLVDLPVGENFQDQPPAVVVYQMEQSRAPTIPTNPHAFSVPTFVGSVAFDPSQEYPDYMTINLVIQHDSPSLLHICSNMFKYTDVICQILFEANKGRTLLFVVNNVMFPKSSGKVLLASADPKDDPIIIPGTFSEDEDLEMLAKSLEDYDKVMKTEYFRSVNASMVDFGLCSRSSSTFWRCYGRKMSATMWHYCGTCGMGRVLNSKLQVKGVDRLRVIDASSMTQLVRGKIHAAVVMIAEHGSEDILYDHNISVE